MSEDWTFIEQPIGHFLRDDAKTKFLLVFYQPEYVLSRFGVTTLSYSEFSAELADKPVDECAQLSLMQWNDDDRDYWNRRICDSESPVVLVLWLDANTSHAKHIFFYFEHLATNSNIYSFHSCPIIGDLFLVFCTPNNNISNDKYNHTFVQNSFLSVPDFSFDSLVRSVGHVHSSQNYVSNCLCLSCLGERDATALWPCGHTAFCSPCGQRFRYQEENCPICVTDLNFCLLLRYNNLLSRQRQKYAVPAMQATHLVVWLTTSNSEGQCAFHKKTIQEADEAATVNATNTTEKEKID